MARRRTSYNVDTRTKILDSHKQFMGGLKTVDTDDSVKDFFLRDVENISLSEFGFLERRYGLVNDANFEFPVPSVQDEIVDPITGVRTFKDRLQGYFEYVRPDRVTETIIFYNGRLYLNKIQVTRLYQYPQSFDPKLGIYNNNIDPADFKLYLEKIHNYTDFTSFNSIDDLFKTGREIEGVRIENRMFFFTGVYPIVYEGTGEFYLLPEFVTNFEQLALFSHNLHTSNLEKTYTEGFPASPIDDIDINQLDQAYFGDIGYAPMFPYMVGEGRGLNLTVNFKIPEIAPFVKADKTPSLFTGFLSQGVPTNQNQAGSQYLELIPEVYYRPSGLTPSITEGVVDSTWTRVDVKNVQYELLENDEFVRVTSLNNLDGSAALNAFAYNNDDPNREEDDVLSYPSFWLANRIFDENNNQLSTNRPLYSNSQNLSLRTRNLRIRLLGIPSGINDIRVDYVIYQAGYQSIVDGETQSIRFQESIVSRRTEIFPAITFTANRTTDYLQFVRLQKLEFANRAAFPNIGLPDKIYVALDTGAEWIWDIELTLYRIAAESEKITSRAVNDPAALWTCNKVVNHYGKLMAYGSTVYPDRVFIGHPQYIHYFPFFFTRDFQSDDQKPILQITPFMNILVIQNETYTWGLKGIDAVLGAPNFYTPFVISPIYGTIAPKSVRPVRNQLFFLSLDGIVSIQSLYAIDEQYNVKHIDKNIENIIPLDPEAIAIQYDNQYWIHFPNTPNFITLRYHVDLRAWMKDTYFEYNGLNEQGQPVKSETIFNGIHKYIRFEDKLIFITNPMKFADKVAITENDTNYRVLKLYVDYSMATDLGETPRTLFETSYLDQDYPFNEKRYLEQKMDFTIQNEYHLGKEPIFRDESMDMVPNLGNDENGNPIHQYAMYRLPLVKNHEYEVVVPNAGGPAYSTQRANIKSINVRLFDIQRNLIRTLNFQEQKPPTPSILNLQTFPGTNSLSFTAYNNDLVPNDIRYRLFSTLEGAANSIVDNVASNIQSNAGQSITVNNVPFGPLVLELTANRTDVEPIVTSETRVRNFQLQDELFDIFTFNPVAPSLPPVSLRAIPQGANDVANSIVLTWVDQNPGSTEYIVQYRNLTAGSGILGSIPGLTQPTYTLNFTPQQATNAQGDVFQFEVVAFYNGSPSEPALISTKLEIFTAVPENITTLTSNLLTDTLRYQWTDIASESAYEIEWRYLSEPSLNFNSEITDRFSVLSQNSINYQFAVNNTQPNLVRLLPNAIVEFKIRGVNANGVSNIPAVLEAMYREHYDHSQFQSEKIDGESGFKVTIPAAKQLTKYGTAPGYVFETAWGVEVRKKGITTFDAERIIPANGNNFFEIKDLEPNTLYEIRVRGRYLLNNAANTVQLAFPNQIFEVQTGNEQATPLLDPTLSNISRPLPEQNFASTTQTNPILMSFTLTNTDARQAKIHYAVNTQVSYPVTTSDPATGNLAQNANQTISNITVTPGSTVYIHYRAFPPSGVNAEPGTNLRSTAQAIPALVTGTFIHSGSVWATRTGYAPYQINSGTTPPQVSTPSGTVGWNPTLPRTISVNTTFNSVAAPLPAHPVPTGLTSTSITSTSVALAWNAVSGVSNYDVRVNGSTILFASSNSLNVTGLSPSTTYTFEVRSRANSTGDTSAWSSAISRTTSSAATAPAAPTSVSISSTSDNQVSFNWPAVSGATSYNWEILFDGVVIYNGTTSSTSVTRTGIPAGQVRARVQACNANGCSAFTNSAFVTVSGSGLG